MTNDDDIPRGKALEDLLSLADGSIDPGRRSDAEARAAASPALGAALAEQRAAVSAISEAAATVSAPTSLRTRIEAERARAERPRAGSRRPRWALPAGLAAAAAAAAAVIVLVLAGGSSGAPGFKDAAALAQRPPAAAPPAPAASDPRLLDVSQDGVAYPNWRPKFGWEAAGQRTDMLDGREATTVFYAKGERRLAYTIVSGDALDAPGGGRASTVEGTPLTTFDKDGRTVVTWTRGGRTCILQGEGVDPDKMRELAAWQGMGAVEF